MTKESWFHLAEIIVMIVFGSPAVWALLRIVSLLRDFPPHRHFNGKIVYPKGYEPSEIEVYDSHRGHTQYEEGARGKRD